MQKTLVKLLVRIVGNKCVTFDGSRVYYWGVPMIVLPYSSFSYMQNSFEKEFGKFALDIIYHAGKLQGKNGTNILLKKYAVKPSESDLSFFMEQSKFVGIGVIEEVKKDVKNNIFTYRFTSSPFAEAYLKQFGQQKKPVCKYGLALSVGALQALTKVFTNNDKELLSVETKCIAKGDPYCEFEIKIGSIWDIKDPYIKQNLSIKPPEFGIADEKEDLPALIRVARKPTGNPDTELTESLKKKYKTVFNFTDKGEVGVVGAYGIITPMDIFVLIFHILEQKYGAKATERIYDAGKYFGIDVSKQIFEKLNLEQKEINIKKALEQIGIYGLGHPELLRADAKNNLYIVKVDNTPGTHYYDLLGQRKLPFDYLLAGFLAGIMEYVLGKNMSATETNCFVQGKPNCVFEIKSRK